jgi:hypothetical protein
MMQKIFVPTFLVALLGFAVSANAAQHHGIEDPSDMQIEAKMEPSWRACTKSEDCDIIMYGCTGRIAANTKHFAEATELAHKVGGNPAEIKCAPKPEPDYAPICQDKVCVAIIPNEQ